MWTIAGGILLALCLICLINAFTGFLRFCWEMTWNVLLGRPTAKEKAWKDMNRVIERSGNDPVVAGLEADHYFKKYKEPPVI
jgi:hypothetical protein